MFELRSTKDLTMLRGSWRPAASGAVLVSNGAWTDLRPEIGFLAVISVDSN